MKKDQKLAMSLNTFKNLHINLSAGELDIGWIILGLLSKIKEGDNYPHPMGGNIVLVMSVLSITFSIPHHFSATTDWTQRNFVGTFNC